MSGDLYERDFYAWTNEQAALLLAHLLKWQSQPERRGRSWRLTIAEQRVQLADILDDSPSLRARLDEIVADAYGKALLSAQREPNLPEAAFPAACPWTFDQAMQDKLNESR